MRKGLGLRAFLEDVRGKRYRFRQFVDVFFFVLILVVAQPVPWTLAAGACFALVGLAVRLWASGFIFKNDELATDGPYAFVRHPLYFGNLLLGIGFALASGTERVWLLPLCVLALPLWGLLFWLFHGPAIKREDGQLSKRFPDAWPDWAARTPALLPLGLLKLKGKPDLGRWSPKQSLHNGDPLYALILLGGLVYLYLQLPKH